VSPGHCRSPIHSHIAGPPGPASCTMTVPLGAYAQTLISVRRRDCSATTRYPSEMNRTVTIAQATGHDMACAKRPVPSFAQP
jgi:hypothetical protein